MPFRISASEDELDEKEGDRRCWPLPAYAQLAAYMAMVSRRLGKHPTALRRVDLRPYDPSLSQFSQLRHVPGHQLKEHAMHLKKFNLLLQRALPFIDLTNTEQGWVSAWLCLTSV